MSPYALGLGELAFPEGLRSAGGTAARTMATMPLRIVSGSWFQDATTAARSGERGALEGELLYGCCVRFVSTAGPELDRPAWAGVRSSTDATPASSFECPGCDTERPVQDSCCPIPVCSKMVEAGGIEPPSRGISTTASTCVVRLLAFPGPRDSDGRDSPQARFGHLSFPSAPPDGGPRVACYGRPFRPRRQGRADVAVN